MRAGSSEAGALAQAARLFGDLLLKELTADQLAELRAPEPAAALAALGVAVPPARDHELDELASQYHAAFLAPHGGGAPPIGSLWTEGRYEGALAARVRELADSAAVEFDREAARGAPIDHLGVLLHLWAMTVEHAPWVASEIASLHMGWADAPLRRVAAEGAGFYSDVAGATASLVVVLRDCAEGGREPSVSPPSAR